MSEKSLDFIASFVTAIATCSLYSVDHAAAGELSLRVFTILERLLAGDVISIILIEGSLFFNDLPLRQEMPHIESLRRTMRKKRIEKIIIRRGITIGELTQFISAMASTDRNIVGSEHILVGSIAVKLQSSENDATSLMNEGLLKVREAFQELSRFRRLNLVSLDEAVFGFITALRQHSRILRIKSEVKSYSEYTYVHASNVAVLCIFQAESIGLGQESLHEIGIAGLLHDVGKMFVPKEVLEKREKLDEQEWEIIQRHPVYGASFLSTQKEVPKLAVLVAFEHHMRFDGSGYPATSGQTKEQHLVSQLLAVADFFDALRTQRPYRKAVSEQATIKLMQDVAGKELNPVLVDNFLASLKIVKSI